MFRAPSLFRWQLTAVLIAVALIKILTGAQGVAATQAAATDSGAALIHPAFEELAIEVNKGTLIRLERPATEVFIANPEIADVQIKSQRIVYLFGKERGETSFYALDSEDNIIFSSNVQVTQSLSSLRSALTAMLPDSAIEARLMGSTVLLKGYVSSPEKAAAAQNIATQLMGEGVINQVTVLQPTQVNLRVRFAEVSRSVLKDLGVSWEGGGSYGDAFSAGTFGRNVFDDIADPVTGLPQRVFQPGPSGNSLVGSIISGGTDLNYAIDVLDQEGFLTVLAEPNLTAISGETANFLAGGEFPIPVPNQNGFGITISYREFGVKLDFTPTVMSSGRINMKVRPEVSDLSTAGAIEIDGFSIPSISTRRAETTVELGSGQSFAIAGLLQNRITQSADKFPGLGDIPILGALFRSESFQREETELLIVVTPYLVRPVTARKLALPTDGFEAPGDFDRFMRGRRWATKQAETPTAASAAQGPSLKSRAGFQID